MLAHCLEYLLPEGASGEAAIIDILSQLQFQPGRTRSTDITLLDTFDRRLHRHGKAFQVERAAGGRTDFVLRDLRDRGRDLRVTARSLPAPRFADEITDTDLRAALGRLIDVRALLPGARVRRMRQRLHAADEHARLAADLYLDRYCLFGAGRASGTLAARLVIDPGERPSKQAYRDLETWAEEHKLKPADGDVWRGELWLAAIGPSPGIDAEPPDLQPEMRSDLAVKRILLVQYQTMRAQEPGLLAQLDTEFLHDFRVAVRRSRSVLGQLKGLFPERTIAAFRRDLSWLGNITGPARDLDVYLLEFPDLEAALPEFMQGELEPLKSLLEQRAVAAHKALRQSLTSARYRRFTDRWAKFLGKPVPRAPSAPNAPEPIRKLAGHRIWKLYRRAIQQGRLIDEQAPGESIHELRKRCKKLRYVTEFIAPLHGGELIRKSIKDLKALQDHLGSFQDAEVQIAHLREWSAELAANPKVPASTLLAVGALIGFLDQHQRERRRQIVETAAEFGRKDNRERFQRLLDELE